MDSGYIIKDNTRIIAKDVPNSNASSECICYRPHSNIICNGCGFWTRGRVRYCCPQHPKVLCQYFIPLSVFFLINSSIIKTVLLLINNTI